MLLGLVRLLLHGSWKGLRHLVYCKQTANSTDNSHQSDAGKIDASLSFHVILTITHFDY